MARIWLPAAVGLGGDRSQQTGAPDLARQAALDFEHARLIADRAHIQARLLDRERQLRTTPATIDSLGSNLAALENRERSTGVTMAADLERKSDLNSEPNLLGNNEALSLKRAEAVRSYLAANRTGEEMRPQAGGSRPGVRTEAGFADSRVDERSDLDQAMAPNPCLHPSIR